jgi:hypothetical protein
LPLLLSAPFILSGHAFACGYHGDIRGGFSGLYPGSITVAVAIADARDRKLLPAARPQTPVTFRRALDDLERFKVMLGNGRAVDGPTQSLDFSLVLISSALWNHFKVDRRNVWAKYHVKSANAGKPVVITDAAVLRAIASRELDMSHAMRLGLISVRDDASGAVASLLLAGQS